MLTPEEFLDGICIGVDWGGGVEDTLHSTRGQTLRYMDASRIYRLGRGRKHCLLSS